MKKRIFIVATIVCLVFVLPFCVFIYHLKNYTFRIYTVENIAEFGTYSEFKFGGYDQKSLVDAVFPEEIYPFFTVKKYSYKICHNPPMHEAYLEVVIEEEEQYHAYINSLMQGKETRPFISDEAYEEWVLSEEIDALFWPSTENGGIAHAEIQKVLFSDETNTVVFLSLHSLDGGLPHFRESFVYFDRFNIDLKPYDRDLQP